ncbi:MAG: hypothetical protein IJT87_06605 [Ruminiclostridium sp.]|nr:hypothetical protein [Ruminiclostridium sp.]
MKYDLLPSDIVIAIAAGLLPNISSAVIFAVSSADITMYFLLYLAALTGAVFMLKSRSKGVYKAKIKYAIISYIVSGLFGYLFGYRSLFIALNADYVNEFGTSGIRIGSLLFVLIPTSVFVIAASLLIANIITKDKNI